MLFHANQLKAATAFFLAVLLTSTLATCKKKVDDNMTTKGLLMMSMPVPISIDFMAHANDVQMHAHATCGVGFMLSKTLGNVIPTNNSTGLTNNMLTDYRLFISDVKMVDAAGNKTPISLEQNSYQYQNVALLDFEDASGACAGGTTSTHSSIKGSVAPGQYVGVEFTLGVPYDINKLDPASLPAPLNIASMHSGATTGFYFARIGFNTSTPTANSLSLHSAGCTDVRSAECSKPFRATISLTSKDPQTGATRIFDPVKQGITVDMSEITNTYDPNLAGNTTCVSGTANANCDKIWTNLGLDANGASTGAGTAFRIE